MPRYKLSPEERADEQERKENLHNMNTAAEVFNLAHCIQCILLTYVITPYLFSRH